MKTMTTGESLLVLGIFGGAFGAYIALGAAWNALSALSGKQTPGQEARERCVKDFTAKHLLTSDGIAYCKAIEQGVDSGRLKP